MANKISFGFAEKGFKNTIKHIEAGGTPVFEVTSEPFTRISKIIDKLDQLKSTNQAIWQHTDKYHIAAIKIQMGTGYTYSRTYVDMYCQGIKTHDEFVQAWAKRNKISKRKAEHIDPHSYGYLPQTGRSSSATSQERRKQASYIVANRDLRNPNSKIPGAIGNATVDRTHLIPFPVTGIESHKGLLIDYDAWLNRGPMQEFEQDVLKYNRHHTIYWITAINPSPKGLEWRYLIYNDDRKTLALHQTWYDDRWSYSWYIDDKQDQILTGE